MDRRLRRAPDAEWVLMYRLGLSRRRIAALVHAEPATVGCHLVIARRQDPGFEAEYQAAAGAAQTAGPSPTDLARMDELIAWVSAEDRFPSDRSGDRGERSMARWLSRRRREAAEGTLDPAQRRSGPGARVAGKPRTRPAGTTAWPQLVAYRGEGNDWPRHKDCDSEREHALGVWIHTQRYKRRRGDLDPVKVKLLDAAVPGRQAGRTRGRHPRR
jgi:hypothetical protein